MYRPNLDPQPVAIISPGPNFLPQVCTRKMSVVTYDAPQWHRTIIGGALMNIFLIIYHTRWIRYTNQQNINCIQYGAQKAFALRKHPYI